MAAMTVDMTRPEIRSALLHLPLNESRTIAGIEVTRREFGWSVEGGQPVSVEAAINLVEIKRRLRE